MALEIKVFGKTGSGIEFPRAKNKLKARPGPLKQIFDYYATMNTPERSMRRSFLTYDEISLANRTMNHAELISFAKDFRIVPDILSMQGLNFAWQRQRQKTIDVLLRSNRIDFVNFVEILARCAVIGFNQEATQRESVLKMNDHLHLATESKVAQRLQEVKQRNDYRPGTRSRNSQRWKKIKLPRIQSLDSFKAQQQKLLIQNQALIREIHAFEMRKEAKKPEKPVETPEENSKPPLKNDRPLTRAVSSPSITLPRQEARRSSMLSKPSLRHSTSMMKDQSLRSVTESEDISTPDEDTGTKCEEYDQLWRDFDSSYIYSLSTANENKQANRHQRRQTKFLSHQSKFSKESLQMLEKHAENVSFMKWKLIEEFNSATPTPQLNLENVICNRLYKVKFVIHSLIEENVEVDYRMENLPECKIKFGTKRQCLGISRSCVLHIYVSSPKTIEGSLSIITTNKGGSIVLCMNIKITIHARNSAVCPLLE